MFVCVTAHNNLLALWYLLDVCVIVCWFGAIWVVCGAGRFCITGSQIFKTLREMHMEKKFYGGHTEIRTGPLGNMAPSFLIDFGDLDNVGYSASKKNNRLAIAVSRCEARLKGLLENLTPPYARTLNTLSLYGTTHLVRTKRLGHIESALNKFVP